MEVDLRIGRTRLLRMTRYLLLLRYIGLPIYQLSTGRCDARAQGRADSKRFRGSEVDVTTKRKEKGLTETISGEA
jgi:hypothetical protein